MLLDFDLSLFYVCCIFVDLRECVCVCFTCRHFMQIKHVKMIYLLYNTNIRFTVHHVSPHGMMPSPFTRQRRGLPHKLARGAYPVLGQLVGVAVLPLMGRV